jgi:prepilin-type N-terminal cleavage/methylation domain-containing protein
MIIIHNKKGFTLIELLVSLTIISLLMTVTFASFSTSRKKSRIAKRIADLKQVQVGLEYYYAVNRAYPSSGGSQRSVCSGYGGVNLAADNVIPGLTPNYIAHIPTDPEGNTDNTSHCYVYQSNGLDYAFMSIAASEMYAGNTPGYLSEPDLIDPARDGGTNSAVVDGSSPTAWKVYSPGGASW